LPLEGFPYSRLPEWPGSQARILAAPVLGAQFVQYLLDIPKAHGSRHAADGRIETFFYVLRGTLKLSAGKQAEQRLTPGAFALVPPTVDYRLDALDDCSLLMLRKPYEPAHGVEPPPLVVGNQFEVPGVVYMGNEGARLQTLLPDELPFDLAMNIFTFAPGNNLPVVETHIMEHGLYFLEGKGVYYLDDEWMEVTADDFIWMGSYVPQSFYATGPVPSKYIYYKNVNRDVPL
jgi:(S)-ureidoglycine aminohydrolase